MGYSTDFVLTAKVEKTPLTEQPVVQDIVKFMQAKNIDFDEYAAARMVTELSKHFKSLDIDSDTLLFRLNAISGYEFDEDAHLEFKLWDSKWYDHHEHMLKLSAEFPSVTFVLDGDGEEQGDVWKDTYKAGELMKAQKAKMVFED